MALKSVSPDFVLCVGDVCPNEHMSEAMAGVSINLTNISTARFQEGKEVSLKSLKVKRIINLSGNDWKLLLESNGRWRVGPILVACYRNGWWEILKNWEESLYSQPWCTMQHQMFKIIVENVEGCGFEIECWIYSSSSNVLPITKMLAPLSFHVNWGLKIYWKFYFLCP